MGVLLWIMCISNYPNDSSFEVLLKLHALCKFPCRIKGEMRKLQCQHYNAHFPFSFFFFGVVYRCENALCTMGRETETESEYSPQAG